MKRFGVFVGTVKSKVRSLMDYGHGGALSNLKGSSGVALMLSCIMGGGRTHAYLEGLGGVGRGFVLTTIHGVGMSREACAVTSDT